MNRWNMLKSSILLIIEHPGHDYFSMFRYNIENLMILGAQIPLFPDFLVFWWLKSLILFGSHASAAAEIGFLCSIVFGALSKFLPLLWEVLAIFQARTRSPHLLYIGVTYIILLYMICIYIYIHIIIQIYIDIYIYISLPHWIRYYYQLISYDYEHHKTNQRIWASFFLTDS